MNDFKQQNRSTHLKMTEAFTHNITEDYGGARVRIQQLEAALQEKDIELSRHRDEQQKLRESLTASIKSMHSSSVQLHKIKSDLFHQYQETLALVDVLEQENQALALSSEAWSNRSIELEFDKLTVQQENKSLKNTNALAASRIAVLERELMSLKAEHKTRRRSANQTDSLDVN